MNTLLVDEANINRLLTNPQQPIQLLLCGVQAQLSIGIANYPDKLKQYYGNNICPDINSAVQRSGIPCNTQHFGLIIRFEQPIELQMHDQDLTLLGDSKRLIELFEVVVIHNASVDEQSKDIGHRNRFPHLKFHRDRNEHQPTPYSLYTRDPRCPEQVNPRTSSTLFISNLVAYLQCMKQRDYEQLTTEGPQSHYDIFYTTDMDEVIAQVMLEHRWDDPQGVGEISMLDNRHSLHASYWREGHQPGYRIGVRYLK
jgi:hypothetical protein